MKFYHGGASRKSLEIIREKCPSIEHGNGFTPQKFWTPSTFYFLDNGAFTESFNPEEWKKALDKCIDMPRKPDFVVLPDVFDNPQATFDRARRFVHEPQKRGLDYYYAAQKPESAFQAVHKALELNAEGVFIGGSFDWKHRTASEIVEKAHEYGLKVHIGMPGDYYWAYNTGADSMDSVSIVASANWSRAAELESKIKTQTSLAEL